MRAACGAVLLASSNHISMSLDFAPNRVELHHVQVTDRKAKVEMLVFLMYESSLFIEYREFDTLRKGHRAQQADES